MNRRSFLLGLATVPVVGITAVAAAPTVVMGIDGGGPDVCCAYVMVDKRYGMFQNENHLRLRYGTSLTSLCGVR